jgi:hypothetical protein
MSAFAWLLNRHFTLDGSSRDQHPPVRGVLAAVAIVLVAAALVLYSLATNSVPIVRSAASDEPIVIEGRGVADASSPVDAQEARDQRADALLHLRQSGPGEESWNPRAGDVFDAIAALVPPVTITERGCYVVGCRAVVTFASESAYRAELAQIDRLAAYRAWTGGKQITSPDVRPDGRVVVALLLFRPD